MKKLRILFVLFSLVNTGCEKHEICDQLAGYWEIKAVSGGIMGWSEIRDFDIVNFNSSNKYYVYYNDTLIQGGTYKIERQEPENYGKTRIEFLLKLNETFDNHPFANFYSEFPLDIFFNGTDRLTLSQANVDDGFNYHFLRKTDR